MKKFYQTKTITKTAVLIFVVALSVAAGFYACTKPTEGIDIIVNTSSLEKAPTLIQFVNANPNSTTALPSTFTATITGSGAQYVQISGGGQNFVVNNGLLPISLTKEATPSPATPVTFNVYASVPGFAPVSQTFSIVGDVVSQVSFPLVEYANIPAGTSVLTTSTALNSGVSPAVKLTTTTNANLSENATLSIPAGTQMLDANGAVINAGALNATVVQYGTSSPTLAASFPGGLNPVNVIGADKNPIPGGVNFVSAGLLGINMMAGTTPVKSFSQPLQMTVELQSGLINFMTGNPVQAGETIPVWSLDETTGQWKSDGTATVAIDGNGKLAATTSVAHLSWWNIDWYYQRPNYNTVSHSFTINIIPSALPWSGTYEVQLQTANGNYLAGFHTYHPQTDFFQSEIAFILGQTRSGFATIAGKYGFSIGSVPNISSAKVVIYDANGKKVAESPLFNLTVTNSVDVNLTAPTPPDLTLTFDITATCLNKPAKVYPSGWFTLTDVTTKTSANVYFTSGHTTVTLKTGDQYTLSTNYSGTVYTSAVTTLGKSDFTIGGSATTQGAALTGVAKYTVATNTLAVTASITLANCN